MDSLIMMLVLAVLAVPVLMAVGLATLLRLRARVAALEAAVHALQEAPPREDVAPTLADWMRRSQGPAPAPVSAAPREGATSPAGASPGEGAATAAYRAVDAVAPRTPAVDAAPGSAAPPAGSGASRARLDDAAPAGAAPPPLPPRSPPPMPRVPVRPDPLTLAFRAARRWLTEGNVPVKVGVLVLFAGVAALLKYASDQGLLRMPIELRLTGVAATATAALAFGWRQREARRGFALAVQGGAVGVLLLVLFAASRLYPLVPVGAAFAGSVVLVAGLCVLAVRQESLALAVLGVLAGFLAPLWLSTGQGSHVALFGYYAVLNAGVVLIAWRRPWRLLNVLGFGFTFGVGTLWGVLRYRPEQFASTEPFLLLFFAMYLAVPILYAAARAPAQRRVLDGCLIFGTPLVAFSLQAGLLDGARMPLAFNALGLAAIYAALAAGLRGRERFAALVAPYAVLAVGFATLAVPLALSARATAAIFALEGAGLVWLALRDGRRLPLVAGIGLQLLAGVLAADELMDVERGVSWLEGPLVTAMLVAVGGFATALSAWREKRGGLAGWAYALSVAWLLFAAGSEITRLLPAPRLANALMLLALAVAWAAAEASARIPARGPWLTAAFAFVAPLLLALGDVADRTAPFAGLGAVAWIAFAIVAARVLLRLRPAAAGLQGLAHAGLVVASATVLTAALQAVAIDAGLGGAWHFALVLLPWLAVAALVLRRPRLAGWPFGDGFERWRGLLSDGLAAVLGIGFVVGLFLRGDAAPLPQLPLPQLPLLNPLELSQLAALGLLATWASARGLDARRALAVAAFAFATGVVLRAAHHWGGVPWNGAMFSTGLVQTCLTLLWSVIGMAAWIRGSRHGDRAIWQAGAVLMALVLAKLVLVDRQYLGNLLGIGSFIAFGLLCVAVGYIAPVPPRRDGAEAPA